MLVAPAMLLRSPHRLFDTALGADCRGGWEQLSGSIWLQRPASGSWRKRSSQIPTPMAPGPVKPTWDSLKENYAVPELV